MEIASVNCGTTQGCRIGVLEGEGRRVRQTMAKIFPNLLKTEAYKVLGRVGDVCSHAGSSGCRADAR